MDTGEPIEQLPRGIALAWGVAATPQRGPKREMSVEKIVDAAIEIADQEGLGAVSMSAVAKRLGYTPMSLYRYVSAKDDLLLLMQEEATGLPPERGEDNPGWRVRLEELYEAQTRIYRGKSWLLAMPILGSPITPNSSAWLDASLEALSATSLTQDERIAASLLVAGAARWRGTILAGYQQHGRASGLSEDEVSERESRLFDAVITDDGYPFLRRAIDAGVFTSAFDPFTFGLDRGLDGLADYIERVGIEREDARVDGPEVAETEGTAGDEPDASAVREPSDIGDEDPDVVADKKYREAQKAVRQAQKVLAEARKRERQTLREAKERAVKRG